MKRSLTSFAAALLLALPIAAHANILPTAVTGGPYIMDIGDSLPLNGSGSSDADGTVVSWNWVVNGNISSPISSPSATTFVSWSSLLARGVSGTGSYPLNLTVTDNDGGTASALTSLTVYNNSPFAALSSGPNPAAVGQSVTFDGSGSAQGDPRYAIVNYSWNFGDGSPVYSESLASAPDGIFNGRTSHVFSNPGTYIVYLTVTDSNAIPKTAVATNVVTVTPEPASLALLAVGAGTLLIRRHNPKST